MRKYIFLTSVLALAACGGGGGGHGGVAPVTVPSDLSGRVTATENDNVTAMKSEVIVSSNSDTELSRSSSTTVNGVKFVSYRLEDIKLYAADSVNTDKGFLQIGMNKNTGRIEDITMEVGGVGAPVARVGNTHQFNAPIFEYVQDEIHHIADQSLVSSEGLRNDYKNDQHWDDGKWVEDNGDWVYVEYGDQAVFRTVDTGQTIAQLEALAGTKSLSGGHWNRIDEVMDVVTYGRDIGNGQSLQYADFGHFNPVYKTKNVDLTGKTGDNWNSEIAKSHNTSEVQHELEEEDYQLFAGGYAISRTELKDTLAAPKNTTFKGMAIGRVYSSMGGATNEQLADYGITSGDGHDIQKAYITKDATLTVDASGKQTLVMPFNSKAVGDKYYDVKLVKNANGTIANPQFTGNEDLIEGQYKLYDAMNHIVADQNSLNMGYYGVNTATETAGTARLYSEKDLGGGVKREYEVQAAWGMKKQ